MAEVANLLELELILAVEDPNRLDPAFPHLYAVLEHLVEFLEALQGPDSAEFVALLTSNILGAD